MKYLLSLALLTLFGCQHSSSTASQAQVDFESNLNTFETLRAMIVEDTERHSTERCFIVGYNNIGSIQRVFGQWQRSSGRYETSEGLELEEALAEVGLTMDRYQEYLQLLSSVGAPDIGHCLDENGGWTRLEIWGPHSAGYDGPRGGVDNPTCGTTIEFNSDGSIPSSGPTRGGGAWDDVTPLQGGWYLKHRCHNPESVQPL